MAARQRMGVGIIGAGNISSQYLRAMRDFPVLDIRGIADMRPEVATARAAEFGVPAASVEALLADPGIDIVVNLTIPRAHVEVGLRAVAAGKHIYGEKPLGVTFADGRKLMDAAKKRGVRVGSAPDTFLGGGHQTARAVVDSGKLGTIIGGTASFGVPGHEYWHPDPAFYYDIGGGPVLDMGPYYITDLVNLLGPVKAVQAMSLTPHKRRPIRSAPKKGQLMPVKVFTHVTGTLQFVSGALVQVALSFDVPKHTHRPIELYGTEAALQVPDPNAFGGEVKLAKPRAETWDDVPVKLPYADANYRSLGVADMAYAILGNRPHRASGALALHVLEVMEAFATASRSGEIVRIRTRVERPAPIADSLKRGRIA
ncbi:MAG: oxidoreductase [Devosia sp. 67-54]|uniref:Gfo/Idh/MocA family protein n=1 Tax=unclassified Devosia TaxID=196773 RepID=UPI00095EA309|nr:MULTISPECIES: Gfo/Idh/MocA family oxidoreductase [unclassified Devosia]MBN9304930.1 Gfo/Idh/MocA family oxidoreductase [Devosia sp.]OJX15123.1 MAG: oxidoreductase [Devosia sp. 67-54]